MAPELLIRGLLAVWVWRGMHDALHWPIVNVGINTCDAVEAHCCITRVDYSSNHATKQLQSMGTYLILLII